MLPRLPSLAILGQQEDLRWSGHSHRIPSPRIAVMSLLAGNWWVLESCARRNSARELQPSRVNPTGLHGGW